ncbi:ArsR/SmtB family transcription factor [Planctomicrobium piriforme]|uniref:DNA-binding transcriptional regulator, ArsR family n=1 Tax=Planctomicrobium piriforme TaxID=1576369 RepID=A0A1I3SAU9_9PLAN|nr:metalloregulator ArsR/SmtB family transcription factor [Planctomicrobium piriforme]SFJ55825.1 DNA-binding transcriptional regulator, ArsR family [Planctomicrobium piriforme]
MPRASTRSDVFNAIAEPRRRQIIDLLSRHRGLAVGAIVLALGLPQPTISKHLNVLKDVGLVSVSKQGQSRVYDLNYEQLRPVYDWVKTFEQHWDHQLDRIRARAEKRAQAVSHKIDPNKDNRKKS